MPSGELTLRAMAGLPVDSTGPLLARPEPMTDKRAPCTIDSCAGIKLLGKEEPKRLDAI